MSLLEAIRGVNLRSSHISRDSSAPILQTQFDAISAQIDASVLNCNLERWAPLLGELTYNTLLVPLSPSDAQQLLAAYEDAERRTDVVSTPNDDASLPPPPPPLNAQEAALRASLGPSIQDAIDKLSSIAEGRNAGCFVKLSSRSPKDAAARSGAFEAFYAGALARHPDALADPSMKLRILCEAEGAALRFARAVDVVRALVLSERVWQDMTLALRHPESWQQNIIIRRWEPVDIDMEFRTFVFHNRLCAVSQYAYQLHSPRLLPMRAALLSHLHEFYDAQVRPLLLASAFETCVIDVAVARDGDGEFRSKIIEINPFLPTTDGGLFSWETERDILEGEREGVAYPVLRVNERPRAGAMVMVPRSWREVAERVEKRMGDRLKQGAI